MRKKGSLFLSTIMLLFLASCIDVTLTIKQPEGSLFQVVMVTNTPVPGSIPSTPTPLQPTATTQPTETTAPTFTATATETAAEPSETPTPTELAIPVSGLIELNARCRRGPGVVYRTLAYLNVGEEAMVFGRNGEATWLLVQKDAGSLECWATAGAISLPIDIVLLPVITEPFTPVPTAVGQPQTGKPEAGQPKPTKVPSTSAPPPTEPYPPPATNPPYP